MSSTHNLSVILTGNATSLRGALTSAGREVQTFTKQVENSGRSGVQAGSLLKTGFAAAAIAVGVALIYAVGQAAAFDREMRNVQSITKVSDAELRNMGQTVINLSKELPQSAKTLAAGLYDIASSGFQGADGMKVLEASAMAASAGLTETEVSARAITAVLNAYGRGAEDAADVSDVLFQTVNLGVVSFEELAGTIGDVVGTAAAATVEIDEVGSAIATMTLSGISAAEAGTSLNRLLQSLIDPSESLAEALKSVGYESGAQALQVDTLSTVMEKLRVASGGNIETLLKWFPEIRAARGALSLMSDEGRNYTKVVGGIEDAEARAGATRAALNEQLKAVSAQFTIFKNRVNAAAIELGVRLLPTVTAALKVIESLAKAGLPALQSGIQRLMPFWRALVEIGGDVVQIGKDLMRTLGPVGALLAGLVGIGAISGLNALGEALEAVSGFLRDHPALIQVVAALLIGKFLTGATVAAGGLRLLNATASGLGKVFGPLIQVLSNMSYEFVNGAGTSGVFRQGLAGLKSALSSPTLAVGLLALGLMGVAAAHNEATRKAEEMRRELESDIDYKAPASIMAGVDQIRKKLEELESRNGAQGGLWNTIVGGAQLAASVLPGVTASMYDVRVAINELSDAEAENIGKALMLDEKYAVVAERLGTTALAVQKFAQQNPDLDPLIMSYDELAAALEQNAVVADKANPKQVAMAGAFTKVADATSDAKDEVDAFKSAIDALLGIELDWFDAQTKARGSMDDLVKSLKETKSAGLGVGDMFNEFTAGGQANRDAISGVASAWIDMAEALAKKGDMAGGIQLLKDVEAELRGVLASAGMAPPKIDALVASLGLVPGNYEALLGLTGDVEAKAMLESLMGDLKGLDETSVAPEVKIIDATGESRATLDAWILYWSKADPTTRVYVDGEPARPSQEALTKWIRDYDAYSPEAQALLNVLDPDQKFKTLWQLSAAWRAENPTTKAYLDTTAAENALARFRAQLVAATRPITVTVNGVTQTRPNPDRNGRWGLLTSYAQGGIEQAHIQVGQRIRYAEPETGGEAYVPRFGNKKRSSQILAEAASWYGMSIVPMSTGGISSAIAEARRDRISNFAAGRGGLSSVQSMYPGLDPRVAGILSGRAFSGGDRSNLDVALRDPNMSYWLSQFSKEGSVSVSVGAGAVNIEAGNASPEEVKKMVEDGFDRLAKSIKRKACR